MISAYAAATRRDYELMMVRYTPDVEFHFAPEFEGLGLAGIGRGQDGMLRLIDAFEEAWQRVEFEPALLLDMGDRAVALGHLRQTGAATGLEFRTEYAQLLAFDRGAVVHEQDFLSWDKALRAAGIDPGHVAR
jgi:ketosteroid isomerase-like protein